jgi:amidase
MYHPFMDTDLCFLPATEMRHLLQRKQLSSEELVTVHLKQIEHLNPKVNAVVTLVAEQALENARLADKAFIKGEPSGLLHGLPVLHKDLQETKGIRTTYGSPIYKNFIPDVDALVVERLKNAGALTLGKTNTPEFGAGSQTFNQVFGETHNPYNLSKTCGGSSGGAAVALACGMTPLADGSDMGGSLRNPASFCNVVGLRPSPGRVPSWPSNLGWSPVAVDGPMARTVSDVALMLAVLAGPDARSPISISESGVQFLNLGRDFKTFHKNTRIAWVTLGLPFEASVRATVDAQRKVFEDLGCIVEDAEPDFSEADSIFKTLRAWSYAVGHEEHLKHHRDQLKDTVIWNTEEGLKLSALDIGRAEAKRTELYHKTRIFMEHYDFMVLPTVQVLPFDIKQRYVTEINSVKMDTYIDWMKSCYFISTIGNPALTVPCGFANGLPVGLQIVGRHQDDLGTLQLGYAYEQLTNFWKIKPVITKSYSTTKVE